MLACSLCYAGIAPIASVISHSPHTTRGKWVNPFLARFGRARPRIAHKEQRSKEHSPTLQKLYPRRLNYDTDALFEEACAEFIIELPSPIPRLRYPTWELFWNAWRIPAPDVDKDTFDRHFLKDAARRSRKALWEVVSAAKSARGRLAAPVLTQIQEKQHRHILEAVDFYENVLQRYHRAVKKDDAITTMDFVNAWVHGVQPPED